MTHDEIAKALLAPFDPSEVKVRSQAGRQLHYVTARTVMNRLDEVLGWINWWDEYTPGENSVMCRLTICLPDGRIITKTDAGGYAGMADSGDDDKSGFSDAFKRAAVKFGVGRYLYRDGVPNLDFEGEQAHTTTAAQQASEERNPEAPRSGDTPRTGKALFAWAREQEQRNSVALLKYLNGWAKLQEFPGRMVDWDASQVAKGYTEACRKLNAIRGNHEPAISSATQPWDDLAARVLNQVTPAWNAEMDRESIPAADRQALTDQFRLLNAMATGAIKAGLIKLEDVEKPGKQGVRDALRSKVALSRLYLENPERIEAAIAGYIEKKRNEVRSKLGMFDPDLETQEAGVRG